jgi:death-on-curing protein
VTIQYPDLVDYLAIAAEITGLDVSVLATSAKVELADSALHAPQAGFGEKELYPEFCDKAGLLLVRLTKNHPLLDGNKRAAWVTLRLFVEMNSWRWTVVPSVDEAERVMLSIAGGEWDEKQISAWLRDRIERST